MKCEHKRKDVTELELYHEGEQDKLYVVYVCKDCKSIIKDTYNIAHVKRIVNGKTDVCTNINRLIKVPIQTHVDAL